MADVCSLLSSPSSAPRVLLGCSGSVATIKVAMIAQRLQLLGASVIVLPTKQALHFLRVTAPHGEQSTNTSTKTSSYSTNASDQTNTSTETCLLSTNNGDGGNSDVMKTLFKDSDVNSDNRNSEDIETTLSESTLQCAIAEEFISNNKTDVHFSSVDVILENNAENSEKLVLHDRMKGCDSISTRDACKSSTVSSNEKNSLESKCRNPITSYTNDVAPALYCSTCTEIYIKLKNLTSSTLKSLPVASPSTTRANTYDKSSTSAFQRSTANSGTDITDITGTKTAASSCGFTGTESIGIADAKAASCSPSARQAGSTASPQCLWCSVGAMYSQLVMVGDTLEWEVWRERGDSVLHVELRRWADLLVVAPLSANTMAKMACGLCDNLLTCVVRAWDVHKPLLFCPAMNTHMYEHPITARHISVLKEFGYQEVPAVSKRLVCGDVGGGAMAEVDTIVDAVWSALHSTG